MYAFAPLGDLRFSSLSAATAEVSRPPNTIAEMNKRSVIAAAPSHPGVTRASANRRNHSRIDSVAAGSFDGRRLNRMALSPFQRRFKSRRTRSGPRDRILRDWRGIDVKELEKSHGNKSITAGAVVKNILGTLQLDRRRAESEIVKVWNQTIDPTVTAHAQPVNLNRGTLFVSVDSSVWLDEIVRYRRHEILQRLQHAMGREMIKKISYRIG
ncbi:MAG: hypothetical protein CMO43_06825 [Verrucomicrobiales bacterium]|nr:hypothetical protein [Verrucomicrobiales bacterium]